MLDLTLPGLDGLEVFRRLRAARAGLPIIMLTARGDESDRVLGLEVGADDYVTKPFSSRELVLRVQSLLRRRAGPARRRSEGPDGAGPSASSTADSSSTGAGTRRGSTPSRCR